MQAGTEMLDVLNRELKYTALKQLLTTALAISMGESLLKYLPLGFNDLMYGYFRTLCVGYGHLCSCKYDASASFIFYRLQGSIGCFCNFCRGNFCVYCDFLFCPQVYYGFGFLGRMCTVLFYSYDPSGTLYQTSAYYILSIQPVVAEDKSGVFTRIGYFMDEKLERRTNVDRN